MAFLRLLFVLLAALLGGAVTSQAPEFAQQYRQRIGGAIDELRAIVLQFEDDARRNGLDRAAALATYERSGEPFLRDRGVSMASILQRYELLVRQRVEMERTPPLLRPILLAQMRDPALTEGAWADFRPAVPIGLDGWVWGGAGAVLGGALASLLAGLLGRLFRRRRPARPATHPRAADLPPPPLVATRERWGGH